jgi:anti-sigma factor RsiW
MIGARPGELSGPEASGLTSHLQGCEHCRALAAEAELFDGLLADALLARANARDFAPFVDQVMARVEGRATRRVPLLDRLRSQWKVLAASATALVLLAAGSVFMYVHKTVEEPERVAAVSMELEGGSTVLQTSDGPVVLLEPDDDTGS